MERRRIEMPEAFDFETELDVRVGDVNYGGHLGNDALLGLLQEARLRRLARDGFSETDAGGPGLIQTDAAVEYLSQAVRGERLRIGVRLRPRGRSGFDVFYRVRAADGREVARARTGMAFFDYPKGRPARMPEAFRARLAARPAGEPR